MALVHFGKRLRFLIPTEVESKLLGNNVFTKEHGGWSPNAKTQGVFFDFSRVEWVDLGALVQVILLLESALREGIKVQIALPLPRLRKSEEEWIASTSIPGQSENVRARMARRRRVREYLEYLQLERVLAFKHLGQNARNLEILRNFDSSTESRDRRKGGSGKSSKGISIGDEKSRWNNKTPLYKYTFPLSWISSPTGEDLKELSKFLAGVVGEAQRGLEAIDAEVLSNVFFYELAQNVLDHAEQTSWALVAAWARPGGEEFIRFDPEDYLEHEREYFRWLSERRPSVVEIVLGDSGLGVHSTLGKRYGEKKDSIEKVVDNETANILIWAFDRWSTRKPYDSTRGTRGLYRVDRIVRKYQGLITLRASGQSVTLDHGGSEYDHSDCYKTRLSSVPGTLLKLWIPAFHEQPQVPRSSPKGPLDLEIKMIDLGVLGPDGISSSEAKKLEEILESARDDRPLCVLAKAKSGVGTIDKSGLQALLRQAVEIRHPATIVLYGLPGGWDVVENAVDSVNSEYENFQRGNESKDAEDFDIWDPVLVIGAPGKTAWIGATESRRKILNALLNSDEGTLSSDDIRGVIEDESEILDIGREFRNDTNLVACHSDGSLELRLTLNDIIKQVTSKIREHIEQGRPGVLSSGPFLTPSLTLVKRWLDIDRILNETCGVELGMFSVASLLMQDEAWEQSKRPNFIYYDCTVSPTCQESLKKYLRINDSDTSTGESGPYIPTGQHVIPSGKTVVVHCDVIVSGESVERCLDQTLRDEATVIAITCIVDGREYPENDISIWGNNVRVISLIKSSLCYKASDTESVPTPINPITLQPEEIVRGFNGEDEGLKGEELPIPSQNLSELILRNNALHFNHVGRPIGRHFTFYLDASKLIKEHVIIHTFNQVIDDWLTEINLGSKKSNQIEIWYPSPEPKPPAPALKFAEEIRKVRSDVRQLGVIRRVPAFGRWLFTVSRERPQAVKSTNLVIIDWAALTGTTITQMIRIGAEAGIENILVCIFLSQLREEEETFFKHIACLKLFPKHETQNLDGEFQPYLPGLEKRDVNEKHGEEEKPEIQFSTVKVQFLARIALRHYERAECPVCQRFPHIPDEKYPTELLAEHVDAQRHSLRCRERWTVLGAQPRDFFDRVLHGTDTDWMIRFRAKLEFALSSTQGRQAIAANLKELHAAASKDIRKPPKKVILLIHLLSVEHQWIMSSPLKIKSLRNILAELCKIVATNRELQIQDRINSVTVLKSTSLYHFALYISELLLSMIDDKLLIDQLLYEIFAFQNHQSFKDREGLSSLELMIKGMRKSIQIMRNKEIELPIRCAETLEILINRIERDIAEGYARPLLPSQAWNDLREEYDKRYVSRHNDLTKAMLLLRPGLDIELIEESIKTGKIVDPSLSTWLSNLGKNWRTCRIFLDRTVLPKLGRLRPIIGSRAGHEELGPFTANRLCRSIDKRLYISELELSKLIRELSAEPNEVLNRTKWSHYTEELEWVWSTFFKPANDGGTGASLIDFLNSAPCHLGKVLKETYKEISARGIVVMKREKHDREGEEYFLGKHIIQGINKVCSNNHVVFCTKPILRELFRELLWNCEKHRIPGNDSDMLIDISTKQKDNEIIFTIRNKLTKEGEPGQGLDLFSESLRPFGAILTRTSRPENHNFTFEVNVTFSDGGVIL